MAWGTLVPQSAFFGRPVGPVFRTRGEPGSSLYVLCSVGLTEPPLGASARPARSRASARPARSRAPTGPASPATVPASPTLRPQGVLAIPVGGLLRDLQVPPRVQPLHGPRPCGQGLPQAARPLAGRLRQLQNQS